jgi:hypothetical protein
LPAECRHRFELTVAGIAMTRANRPFAQLIAGAIIVSMTTGAGPALGVGDEQSQRRFFLNEHAIQGLAIPDSNACNPPDVLRDLFRQIRPVARVYPTENYYYFSFFRDRKSYSGSLRLALDSRDKGILQFVCYETSTNWLKPDTDAGVDKSFTIEDGVSVRKLGDLEYDVEFQGMTVKFLLNKVDQTPTKQLRTGERFAGRIFDESGIMFDLIYSERDKAFFFVLDWQGVASDLLKKVRAKTFLSKRTGFLFFEDTALDRLVLIAVNASEVRKNTIYDGPFDQLPENFYENVGFWKYVYDAYPEMVGKLTPGGTVLGSTLVFAIASYREYVSEKDLSFIAPCMRKHAEGTGRILCLTGQKPKNRRR